MTEEEQLEEYRTQKHQLKLLVESDGWKLVQGYYQAVKIGRRNQMFGNDQPGLDGLVELGKIKSELAGMDLIMSIPLLMSQEADDEEKALLDEMENDDV